MSMRGPRPGKITTVSGKALVTMTVANGNTSTAAGIQPGYSRLSNIQKAFEFYRFTRLSFLVPPWSRFETTWPENSQASAAALGYYPEETTATLTTVTPTALLGLDASIPLTGSVVDVNAIGGTVNNDVLVTGDTTQRRLTVPKRVLLGTTTKWFRTNTTTSSEVAEITQGQLIFAVADSAGANTVVLNLHMSYTIEFCGNCDSTVLTLAGPVREDRDLGMGRFTSDMIVVREADGGDEQEERKSVSSGASEPPRAQVRKSLARGR